jgi:hypothetical protein
MSDSRNGSKPWTLSWVHVLLALAVGAGLPLLWMAFEPPVEPHAVAVAEAGAAAGPPDAETAPSGHELAPEPAPPAPSPATTRADAKAPVPAPQIPRVHDPNGDLSPDITDFINNGEVPTMAEVISRLHAAGVRSGLGAFNPPGTRPPLVGLAVPAEFVLPEGYVRHHQATDDGQRIEPILMFAPDHPLFDAAGRPIAMPKDRVVPPELAPPGLPVRRIVIPAPTEPGRPGR